MPVQSGIPQFRTFRNGIDVAGAHHVVLFHFLNVTMVAYPILTRKKVQIPQLRLIDNRHHSPAVLCLPFFQGYRHCTQQQLLLCSRSTWTSRI